MQFEVQLRPVELAAEIVADHVVGGGNQLTAGGLRQLTAVAMVTGDAPHVSRLPQPAGTALVRHLLSGAASSFFTQNIT